MLGQLIFDENDTHIGVLEQVEVMGMTVLRVSIGTRGRWYRQRLRQVLAKLRRYGIRRILAPIDFSDWDIVAEQGMKYVDYLPFLRANAAPLLLLAMKRAGISVEQSVVALRGTRVSREMIDTAEGLVPRVRDISITAPSGGQYLQMNLREQWGLAVHPDDCNVDGVICFDEGAEGLGNVVLRLYQNGLDLAGLTVSEQKITDFCGGEPLSVLAASWETGNSEVNALEFYLT